MSLTERVETRLAGEVDAEQFALLHEICDLASTRVCLRVKAQTLPAVLTPIAADIAVKIWRRRLYEGIATEGADKITTSFVEKILDEYADEFDAYMETAGETSLAVFMLFAIKQM